MRPAPSAPVQVLQLASDGPGAIELRLRHASDLERLARLLAIAAAANA